MPRLDFDAAQASPQRLLEGPGGNLFQPRGRLAVAHFYNRVVRNFDDELQSCTGIWVRGMNSHLQHRGLAGGAVEDASPLAVPAPAISSGTVSR